MRAIGRAVATNKGGQTKAAILQAALDMFQESGYEETTMRAIAERAGVSLGNAYYYFHSKEHLIQAFYHRTHEEHLEACRVRHRQERRHQASGSHGQPRRRAQLSDDR